MAAAMGLRIKELREGKRLLQHDLAERLRKRGYGTTQATVSRWESGQVPRGYVLRALAEELDVSVDELYGSDEDEEESSPVLLSHHEMLAALAVALEPFHPRARDELQAVQA